MSGHALQFTILGSCGFIGSALVDWLESHGHLVHAVTRACLPALLASRKHCGHVINCIGASKDQDGCMPGLAEAHICLVARCVSELCFDSFMLLSSTNVYRRSGSTDEDAAIYVRPTDPTGLFALTKLAGEEQCLRDPRTVIRVARLSNVYGINMPVNTFLGRLLSEGERVGRIVIEEGPSSTNDYIGIGSVVRRLPEIALRGRHRVYNLASGRNTSHDSIATSLRTRGWQVHFDADAPTVRQKPIETMRYDTEFGYTSDDLLTVLPTLSARMNPTARSVWPSWLRVVRTA